MRIFNATTPVHSFIGFDLASKIVQAAFARESALARCPPNLSHLLETLDDMRPEYSNDMTLTIKCKVNDEELSPSDEDIRKAFAAYIVVFAAHMLDLDWHANTGGKTPYEDLMSGKFFDKDISFFYGHGGLKTVRISDVVLLASAIAGLDLSRWPADRVKDIVGESLNPVEYEVLATAINGIVTANEELEKKTKQLEAEYQAKRQALIDMTNNVKKNIYNVVALALKKNLAYANANLVVNQFVPDVLS